MTDKDKARLAEQNWRMRGQMMLDLAATFPADSPNHTYWSGLGQEWIERALIIRQANRLDGDVPLPLFRPYDVTRIDGEQIRPRQDAGGKAIGIITAIAFTIALGGVWAVLSVTGREDLAAAAGALIMALGMIYGIILLPDKTKKGGDACS